MMPQNYFASRFAAPPVRPMLPARPIVAGTQPPTLSMPGQMGVPKFSGMPPRPQFGGIMAPAPMQNAIAQRLGMAF